jgi:hypothetical protein
LYFFLHNLEDPLAFGVLQVLFTLAQHLEVVHLNLAFSALFFNYQALLFNKNLFAGDIVLNFGEIVGGIDCSKSFLGHFGKQHRRTAFPGVINARLFGRLLTNWARNGAGQLDSWDAEAKEGER